jgi:membrane-bound ClpP family serine protease
VSVVTTGEMVEPDEQVEVVRVKGTRTVVKPVKAG